MTRHFRISFISILYSPLYSFFFFFLLLRCISSFPFSFIIQFYWLPSFFFMKAIYALTTHYTNFKAKFHFIFIVYIWHFFFLFYFFLYTFVFRFIFFVQPPPSHSHISVFLYLHINPFYRTPSTRFITRQPHLARREVYFFVSLYQAFVYYFHYSPK